MTNIPTTIIQQREYQEAILKQLNANFNNIPPLNTIAEVDTGLGKRVLTYLLIRDILKGQRVLLLLHSTTSYSETLHYFKDIYGGFEKQVEFQGISSRTPSWLKKKILTNAESRIIATTPQTFYNAFQKLNEKPRFICVIINEVDKIVRRQGDERLLIYPYNYLIPYFIDQGTWIVGLTGTIRDSHIFYNTNKDKIEIRSELVTLDNRIPDLYLIQMDTLIQETDISSYLNQSLSFIKAYPVKASDELMKILELINHAIKDLRSEILEETMERNPSLLAYVPKNKLALVSGMLEAENGNNLKYQGLLLIRKYCTAMQGPKFRKFLYRLKKIGVTKELIQALPYINKKVETVQEIIKKEPKQSKTVVLCSYLDTADILKEKIEEMGVETYLVTGQVRDKANVLNNFRKSTEKAALIMTSVGERDIDLPESNLLLVYDSINTVKTMYQRMKRTRGGLVLCLYYQDTFEQEKVKRLLANVAKKYPWSSVIE